MIGLQAPIGLRAPIGLSPPIGLSEHRASCTPHFPSCTPQGPMLGGDDKLLPDDPDEHEDLDERKERKRWVRKGIVPVHAQRIGSHRIHILKYNRRIGIKVDDAAYAFIAEFVVPMMRDVLRKMAMNSEHDGAIVPVLPEAPRSVLPFPTPTVTGKISWHAPSRSWRIFTQECKDGKITTTDLEVDVGLGSPAKRRKYKEACQLWNKTDKSRRMRIPVRLDFDK